MTITFIFDGVVYEFEQCATCDGFPKVDTLVFPNIPMQYYICCSTCEMAINPPVSDSVIQAACDLWNEQQYHLKNI